MWDADQYLKFADERSRPFFDLVGQVRNADVRTVVDLGCGPGQLTRTLLDRWPAASVLGVDNSPEMLTQAKAFGVPGRLVFQQADVAAWQSDMLVDLIVSNAALQWLSGHETLIPRLAGMLSKGGTLAVQMPNRFHTPSQAAIEETVADSRWSDELKGIGLHRKSVHPLGWYIERLHDLGFHVNAWETTYHHTMTGDNPALEWLKGTALRPLLARLSPTQTNEFLADLGERLKRAYPARNGITVVPFPRMFFVATRSH